VHHRVIALERKRLLGIYSAQHPEMIQVIPITKGYLMELAVLREDKQYIFLTTFIVHNVFK
jgi:hypothetical protein